jgi:hypothetical protein
LSGHAPHKKKLGDTMAKDSPPPAAGLSAHEQLVTDALLMLDYAIGSGVKTADGHPIPDDAITAIESTADKLGLLDGKPGSAALSASDWAAFDIAYYKLATALAPVTGETLRNTMGRPPRSRTASEILLGDSPALRFTRCLWYVSLGFAAFVLCANWYLNVKAENSNTDTYLVSRTILELIMPWMYGGLGACVYLLRSAHTYIYLRTFDVRRKPEYSNRILLGAIAGGAIILFANNIAGDEGTVIQLGSAALGFLAGYNTDLLFNAMERISNALLPKLGIDTIQKVPPVRPPDFNDLADRIDKAKGPDKAHYKAVMSKMYNLPSSPKRGGKEK